MLKGKQMQKYSHVSDVPLALAVFLAYDTYDHNPDPYTISATTLLKPLRQIILGARVPPGGQIPIADELKSAIGSAIHDGIEQAWTNGKDKALAALGYPPGVIKRVKFNPAEGELKEGDIPVYMEQRLHKKIGKWTISGKFDFIGDGKVQDFKSTSTFTYTNQTNGDKYTQQGSIYRWLAPDKITQDVMEIHYIFTDWKASRAKQDPDYPQKAFHTQRFNLMSVEETERFIRNKLELIERYWDAAEADIPECSDEDLWRSDPVYKYYKNKDSTGRSTKNFDDPQDAYMRLAKDGHVGKVVMIPGQVIACKYCPAFAMCSQKDQLIREGHLIL